MIKHKAGVMTETTTWWSCIQTSLSNTSSISHFQSKVCEKARKHALRNERLAQLQIQNLNTRKLQTKYQKNTLLPHPYYISHCSSECHSPEIQLWHLPLQPEGLVVITVRHQEKMFSDCPAPNSKWGKWFKKKRHLWHEFVCLLFFLLFFSPSRVCLFEAALVQKIAPKRGGSSKYLPLWGMERGRRWERMHLRTWPPG